MKISISGFGTHRLHRSAVVAFLSVLLVQPLLGLVAVSQPAGAQRKSQRKNSSRYQLSEDQSVAHVLTRLTFGARPGDFERVKTMGVQAFIALQLDPDAIENSSVEAKLAKLPTLNLATPVLIEQYTPPKPTPVPSPTPAQLPSLNSNLQADSKMEAPKTDAGKVITPPASEGVKVSEAMAKASDSSQKNDATTTPKPKPTPVPRNPQMVVTELQRASLLRAVYSERQLFEMMVGFWENHFSIFANKDDDRYLVTSFDRDTIRPFAMGRFRDLLGATAHSPAMLFYLDNWRSSVARPYPASKDKPAGVDGGLNENYARELLELHTMGVDGGYTQKDVQEVARCFTGWTIQKPNEQGLFLYRPGLHDKGEKNVLGHKILAGGGLGDAERVLDILAAHPATARFVATKLARRFISDDPPPAVIDRAAAVFLKTDGSIRETLRAIITAPEFFSPMAYRMKIRSPFEYVVAALRTLNAETDVDPTLLDWTRRMGQSLFGRVTPDGYSDRAEQWLSAGAMLERFNFANALATNRIKGTRIDAPGLSRDEGTTDSQAVADRLTLALLAGDVSQQTRSAIEKINEDEKAKTVAAVPPLAGVNYSNGTGKKPASAVSAYVAQLITMLVGSPEFQRR